MEEITLCSGCYCMTKSIRNGKENHFCEKCGYKKAKIYGLLDGKKKVEIKLSMNSQKELAALHKKIDPKGILTGVRC